MFLVATLVGDSLLFEHVYHACQIRVEDGNDLVDLVVHDMVDFDVLIGIDWLYFCHATLNGHANAVKFEIPNKSNFILSGVRFLRFVKLYLL